MYCVSHISLQKSTGRQLVSAQTPSLLSNLYPYVGFDSRKKMQNALQIATDMQTLMKQVLLSLEICLRKSKKHTEDQELIFEQCAWGAKQLTRYEVRWWFGFMGQGIQAYYKHI